MNYRPEIDGLRAVAVLPVILFHAGFATFEGGYVGVDVFFVISGYLITSIIIHERANGTFSLIGFYERRMRRILPALLLVTLCCFLIAWFWMLPNQLEELSKYLIAVPLFASNILLWRESGYFAPAAELNPLLHTWSLALEEQYYVLFPVLLIALWGLGLRRLGMALAAAGLLSLALAEWGSINQPVAAFFLLPTRGWELLLGGLVAVIRFDKGNELISQAHAHTVSFLGIALIAWAVFTFDSSTPLPGTHTLIPATGTALIILSATPKTLVGRLLSHRMLVGVGLISYSAYLWHQPLFAFARSRGLAGNGMFLLLALVSLALAYITWRLVERPFRDKRVVASGTVFVGAVVVSLTTVLIGWICITYSGFPGRLSKEQQDILAFRKYQSGPLYRRGVCFLRADQSPSDFAEECDAGARMATTPGRLFLWGDSFAAHLYPGLKDLRSHAILQYTSACPPLLGVGFDYRTRCDEIEDYVLAKIASVQPEVIVLAGRWKKHDRYLGNLEATLLRLKEISTRSRVVLIGSMPEWEPSLPEVLARSHLGISEGLYLHVPSLPELRRVDAAMMKVAHSVGASFLAPLRELCQENECLASVSNGSAAEPIAYDHAHLTERSSALLVRRLSLDALGVSGARTPLNKALNAQVAYSQYTPLKSERSEATNP